MILLIFLFLAVTPAFTQIDIDPKLQAAIEKIPVIDNHAHPLGIVPEGQQDTEYDALTFEELEPFALPVRLRPDNPEFIAAWQQLYGYGYSDNTESHVKELLQLKKSMMQKQGDRYPQWVLDKLGIETMLANRVSMGGGLTRPRFQWVSFVDALIFPLNNAAIRRENPDRHAFFTGEDRLLKRYFQESKVNGTPATLAEYLTKVVTPTLERHKTAGALAVKFEAAYLRSLDFSDPSQSEAEEIYARYAKGGEPPADQYKKVQDFLFRNIAREAGRLGLAVHIHVLIGAGSYYQLKGANPLLLEPVFNDPTLRKTNFVIIHGGWPYVREVASLLMKPNVYADCSAQTFLLYPRALSQTLRVWLEYYPEKVMIGTDAEPFAPEANWEEFGWLTIHTARTALALALTEMKRDGEIDDARALELARMFLHDNAAALYHLSSPAAGK